MKKCANVTSVLTAKRGGIFCEKRTTKNDEVRSDISVLGFWSTGQVAFLHISWHMRFQTKRHKIHKPKYCENLWNKYVREKRKHNERMQEVEHGNFNLLVFSSNAGMGQELSGFYKRLSELISEKRKQWYDTTASWIKRKVSFSIINSICLRVRVSRSTFGKSCGFCWPVI